MNGKTIVLVIILLLSVCYSSKLRKSRIEQSESSPDSSTYFTKVNNTDSNSTSMERSYYSSSKGMNKALAKADYSERVHPQQENITCTNTNCPYPNTCVNETVCLCDLTRANYFSPSENLTSIEDLIYCQYERRKLITIFLLEFFVPIGAGHLYNGLIANGIVKMILFLGLCVTPIGLLCFSIKNDWLNILIPAGLGMFAFIWLLDVIFLGLNKMVDDNGVLPQKW